MQTRVLVTDGQLRSSLAVVRSLGKHDVSVICGESTRFATAFLSKYVDGQIVYPSAEDSPDHFREFLLNYLADSDVDVLLPVGHHTTKIVSEYRDEFTEHVRVPIPKFEIFSRALDKRTTLKAAIRAGVPIPETRFPDSVEEAVEAAADIGYPVVIKPRQGHGSRGLRFVESSAEFRDEYDYVHEIDPFPLVQERLPQDGAGLGASFLLTPEGDVGAEFAYQRLREYPVGGGPSTLRESIEGNEIRQYAQQLLKELDWDGLAMVEFKIDSRVDEPRLMEVNPRFWGSLHLPIYAGVDFPWLTLQQALGEPVGESTGYTVGVRCRYLLFGDILNLVSRRSWDAVKEFFPMWDESLHYDILSTDDPMATIGRVLAMSRFALSTRMWNRAVFRNQ